MKWIQNWFTNDFTTSNTFPNALWNLFVVIAIAATPAVAAMHIATTFSFLDILICTITTHAVTWKRRYYVHIVRDATTFSHLYNVKAQKEVWLCTLVCSLSRSASTTFPCALIIINVRSVSECAMSGDKREKSENADEKRNQFSFHFSSSCIVGCHRCGYIKLCQHRKMNGKFMLFLVSSLSWTHANFWCDKWNRFS